jgi:hypothetical protein
MIWAAIFGGMIVITFGTVLFVIVKGERELDKAEPKATK